MRKQRESLPAGAGVENGKNAESLRFLLDLLGRFAQIQRSMKRIMTLLLAVAFLCGGLWETQGDIRALKRYSTGWEDAILLEWDDKNFYSE